MQITVVTKATKYTKKYYERFENFSDEHKQLLERMAKSMMQRFAETVTAEQYDDLDEWIDFIQKFECFTFQELQYINRLWTDEAKEKYRIQKTKERRTKVRFSFMSIGTSPASQLYDNDSEISMKQRKNVL